MNYNDFVKFYVNCIPIDGIDIYAVVNEVLRDIAPNR